MDGFGASGGGVMNTNINTNGGGRGALVSGECCREMIVKTNGCVEVWDCVSIWRLTM